MQVECQEENYGSWIIGLPSIINIFGLDNWRIKEMKIVKRKTRKILTVYKTHHPRAVQVGCILRGNGRGKVMLQIEVTYKAVIISVAEYHSTQYEEDPFVNIVEKP